MVARDLAGAHGYECSSAGRLVRRIELPFGDLKKLSVVSHLDFVKNSNEVHTHTLGTWTHQGETSMASKVKRATKGNDNCTVPLVSDDDIPSQPGNLDVGIDLIYQELTEPYLTLSQRIEFKNIYINAQHQKHCEDAEAQFITLYSRSTAFERELCRRIAVSAVSLAGATLANHQGNIGQAKALMEQASAVLPIIQKRFRKLAKQDECIKKFAAALLKIRPEHGWESIDHAARAGQPKLQKLLRAYKKSFGELWKMDSGILVMKWLLEKQSDVYNAYLGIPSPVGTSNNPSVDIA